MHLNVTMCNYHEKDYALDVCSHPHLLHNSVHGTYVYYCCDEGQWKVSANTKNEYFVDGTLICTRWTDPVNYPGQELREWWEITSIENGVMTWKAVRTRQDGTTFVVTFTMQRVKED